MRWAAWLVAARCRVCRRSAISAGSVGIALLTSGCLATISGGPPRLFSVDEEVGIIRTSLPALALLPDADETSKKNYRNNIIAARMYAIDIQYTAYEAALTRERQGVGFGAAAATLGLTTGSTLAASSMSKDILTGLAGVVTGTRAAYENDILFAHSIQWIQSQMRARRADVATRLLSGTKVSTDLYPLAAALTDLEAYYRAGTFTGGLISTTATLGTDVRFSEEAKDETLQVEFRPSTALDALTACVNTRPGAKAKLEKSVGRANLLLLLSGNGDVEGVLQRAVDAGTC